MLQSCMCTEYSTCSGEKRRTNHAAQRRASCNISLKHPLSTRSDMQAARHREKGHFIARPGCERVVAAVAVAARHNNTRSPLCYAEHIGAAVVTPAVVVAVVVAIVVVTLSAVVAPAVVVAAAVVVVPAVALGGGGSKKLLMFAFSARMQWEREREKLKLIWPNRSSIRGGGGK